MKKIGVLGTGTMGAGIIQVLAQNGFEVVMRARRQTSVDKGIATVEKNLDRLIAKEKLTTEDKADIMSRIKGSTDIEIIKDADLVIEAATEDMDAKKALFAELDALCKSETIIATNTSSLSITEIATATNRPDKIIGMHFFNPVPMMKLVEIILGLATSEETKQTIVALTQTLGKTAVQVEESPGFVVNRLLIPMINEAAGILADGVAKAEDIEEAMKLGANHPMGPLALGDLVGLDV
ncbi:MAG TPA: 3-hydroxyacyl-CoA dehydrogenase NAD-binding domain-containing protein, partial [Anaerovoracaceae bacterium]|nr:3-hydroxyacyl-CoA dehydrogenase NAD-binding domain-containing protein [Anaerovoracaceae bacterium]